MRSYSHSWAAIVCTFAGVLLGGPIVAQDQAGERLSLERYDCAQVPRADEHTRLVGQVIGGGYREWNERYSRADGTFFLICIARLVPDARTLTLDEAQQHLTESQGHVERSAASNLANGSDSGRVIDAPRAIAPIPLPGVIAAERNASASSSGSSLRSSEPHAPSSLHDVSSARAPRMGRDDPQSRLESSKDKQSGEADNKEKGPPLPSRPPSDESPSVQHPTLDGLGRVELQADAHVVEKQQVGTVDTRVRVTNTSSFPWNVVAAIYLEFPDGTEGVCTGTLVSSYIVLTAGHCVHSLDHGGYVVAASVAPGQYQLSASGNVVQPYSERSAQHVATSERWKQLSSGSSHIITDYTYDYAAIFFDTPWSFTSTFMPVVYDDTATFANNAGYPGSVAGIRNNSGQWTDAGDESSDSRTYLRSYQLREFLIDSSPGNSGGPFWYRTGDSRYLLATLSYGRTNQEITGGPWMGGGNAATIRSWVGWTPSSGSPTASARGGLRQTAVFSSKDSARRSFLRFYNGSVTSGSVTLTISDGDTGRLLGTWRSGVIPSMAELQYDIGTIEQQISPRITAPPTIYSVAIESTFDGYFQNVLWNSATGALTNLSGCGSGLSKDVSNVMGFHSSLLQFGYPSFLYLHNVGATSAGVTIRISDAATGVKIGDFFWSQVPPDATYYMDSAYIDSNLKRLYNFTPAAGQNHYNISLVGDFTGYLEHIVFNIGPEVATQLSAKCDLKRS